MPTRVRALEGRIGCEITFPRLVGYRYDIGGEKLPTPVFTEESQLALSTQTVPTRTELDPCDSSSICARSASTGWSEKAEIGTSSPSTA